MQLKLNNYQLCSRRDKGLIELLCDQVSLNTHQIQLLLFGGTCLRIVQRRLTKLTELKKIMRSRVSIEEPFFYYLERKPGQVEHVLGVSWIYTWVSTSLTSVEALHSFDREVDYKILRPDALISVKNTWSNSISFFFAEMDIAGSGNNFADKVKRYSDFYGSESYLGQWWAPLAKRFPVIRVVTDGSIRAVQGKIEKANVHGLEFQVFSLENVKEECLHGRSSNTGIRAI